MDKTVIGQITDDAYMVVLNDKDIQIIKEYAEKEKVPLAVVMANVIAIGINLYNFYD